MTEENYLITLDGLCTQIWKRGERRFKLKKKTCLKGWTAAVGNLIWKKNCNSSNSLFCSSWTWLYFFFSEVKDQLWVKCNIGPGGSSFAPTIQESLVWVFKASCLFFFKISIHWKIWGCLEAIERLASPRCWIQKWINAVYNANANNANIQISQ